LQLSLRFLRFPPRPPLQPKWIFKGEGFDIICIQAAFTGQNAGFSAILAGGAAVDEPWGGDLARRG